VFSEDQYLNLANMSYSWQAGAFTNAASQFRLCLVGVSLVDPNMRRWLSWVQSNRVDELRAFNNDPVVSTSHFWIEKEYGDPALETWIEAAVAHLGVRLVWIKSWADVSSVMEAMIGV
jgi:hypothetical protein